ncbi:hypothetical protein [Burkholderia sp. RF2-non_BP3]|uniref:hypothetical protein n=1 Tax=Burkholderia sp. RF2-non_BP3 TaxID=1637844 RepID=UPI0007553AC2|nr:hypothetical protein [Burkholderia sp. RF2-non_BP3]KUY61141.1 hypothetical protein WS45_05530 [Burkholderia sp. RF2-non_BP3]
MIEWKPAAYVVDDDESLRLSREGLLRSSGLSVLTFKSTQDVLAFPKHDASTHTYLSSVIA